MGGKMSRPRRRVVMKVVHVDLFSAQQFVRPVYEVGQPWRDPRPSNPGREQAAMAKRERRRWRNQPVQEIPNG